MPDPRELPRLDTTTLPHSINEPPGSNVIPPESGGEGTVKEAPQIKRPQPVAEEGRSSRRSRS